MGPFLATKSCLGDHFWQPKLIWGTTLGRTNFRVTVQQLYTAGIALLEAYLLPMANNQRTRKERLSKEGLSKEQNHR